MFSVFLSPIIHSVRSQLDGKILIIKRASGLVSLVILIVPCFGRGDPCLNPDDTELSQLSSRKSWTVRKDPEELSITSKNNNLNQHPLPCSSNRFLDKYPICRNYLSRVHSPEYLLVSFGPLHNPLPSSQGSLCSSLSCQFVPFQTAIPSPLRFVPLARGEF